MTAPTKTRRMNGRQIRSLVAAVVVIGAIVFLLVGGLSRNVVYYRTVSEAIQQREAGNHSRFRLAGHVSEGTIVDQGDTVAFDVTDGTKTAHVIHQGDPPQLFQDGAPIVAEGSWDGDHFASDRIMIRHGSEYKPPEQPGEQPEDHPGS